MSENFISYEQLKTILKPGMTGRELSAKLAELLKLPNEDDYVIVCKCEDNELGTEYIKRGVYVIRKDHPWYLASELANHDIIA